MDSACQLMTAHHDHLAAWLRDGCRTSLDSFLEAHHPDFSLVTTAGEVLGLDDLRAGLEAAGATKPGLDITVSSMTSLAKDIHRFIERHLVDDDVVDARIVTVVLRGEKVLALQETARRAEGR